MNRLLTLAIYLFILLKRHIISPFVERSDGPSVRFVIPGPLAIPLAYRNDNVKCPSHSLSRR